MPSPFPGMDPYLEGDLWTSVHAQLGAEVARQLMPRLRPRYAALTEKRYVVTSHEDAEVSIEGRYPDVGVVETATSPTSGLGLAIATAPLQMMTAWPDPVPHTWVEIRDTATRRLVTAIEFLSPTNKRGTGRREYLRKRRRFLISTAHLLEIDLVRQGRRVPMVQALPPAAYFIFLSRADSRPLTEVWPIGLDHPLPTVPVPLLKGDADVPLDLQWALTNVYDLCGYDLVVDYTRPPDVTLPPDAMAWADERLRAAGKRP